MLCCAGREPVNLLMFSLPTGTITFLFTNLEGSTRLMDQRPQAMAAAMLRHNQIIREAVVMRAGSVFEQLGDGMYAAFARASDGVAAALEAQLSLQAEDWRELAEIRVSMALHTGDVELWGEHYFGIALFRCAGLLALCHAGQVLLSGATAELVSEALPQRASMRYLGDYRLTTLSKPQRVAQLLHPNLPAQFPVLRSVDCLTSNGPLTGRERDVVALIARGYSNRQIAETLVVASSTVERHVANVLSKLNLSSRTQVAAWAGGNVVHGSKALTERPRLVVVHDADYAGGVLDG
jgi:class 3 adenylate cyclase/DNA-binding CsgD family transcriptional regulator